MTRNDSLYVQREDEVTGPKPVADRASPHDRMTANKQDVSCEDRPVSRDIDHRIAEGMRWTDFQQMHLFASDVQVQFPLKSDGWRRDSNALKIESAKTVHQEFAKLPHLRRCFQKHGKLTWRDFRHHLLSGARRSDNLSLGYQLISIAMIAVSMRVHDMPIRAAAGAASRMAANIS